MTVQFLKKRLGSKPSTFSMAMGLVGVTTLLLSNTAAAQEGEGNVEMELSGYVEPRCEFTDFNSSAIDFSIDSTSLLSFSLYCNLAMTLNLNSKNGGLLHETLASLQGRSAEFERQYDAVLALTSGGFSWDTNSIAMQEGVSFSTGDTVVFDTAGMLAISLREPVAGGHAGDYVDVISVTLSPSLAALN